MTEATDQNSWNKFVVDNSSPASFLQSWQWGEFQKSLGNRVYRLQIAGKLQAQIIVKRLNLGKGFLEIPKGPVLATDSLAVSQIWEVFKDKIKELGRKEKAVLARVNPPYDLPADLLVKLNFQHPKLLMRQREPEQTLLMDLSKPEDELFANMHEKARYNIRLAHRRGVTVQDASTDQAAFQKFLAILDETSKRDQIALWPHERFWKFRETFLNPGQKNSQDSHAIFLVGEYQREILAGAIVMLFGDAGTYLYAGSSSVDRAANAPSAVLWEAIRQSKRQGKRWYDMWGIAPRASGEGHPWAGITRFKSRYVTLGKTGKEIYQPGTRDLVLDKKFYNLFKLAKKLRP